MKRDSKPHSIELSNSFAKENSMSETALIVIDVQESFRHRPYWTDAGLSEFVSHQQFLIDGCVSRKVPVVQILHQEDQEISRRPVVL